MHRQLIDLIETVEDDEICQKINRQEMNKVS